jgi:hypothetical protein
MAAMVPDAPGIEVGVFDAALEGAVVVGFDDAPEEPPHAAKPMPASPTVDRTTSVRPRRE